GLDEIKNLFLFVSGQLKEFFQHRLFNAHDCLPSILSKAASNSSIVSSPGHLPHTSFNQPGFTETTAVSQSPGRECRFLVFHQNSPGVDAYSAPFRWFFQVDQRRAEHAFPFPSDSSTWR